MIIEYMQGGRLKTIVCKDHDELTFSVRWLKALATVSLIVVWTPC